MLGASGSLAACDGNDAANPLLPQWCAFSGLSMEEPLHEIASRRRFGGSSALVPLRARAGRALRELQGLHAGQCRASVLVDLTTDLLPRRALRRPGQGYFARAVLVVAV